MPCRRSLHEAVSGKKLPPLGAVRRLPKKKMDAFAYAMLVFPVGGFALGTWQVMRSQWKNGLINELKEKTSSVPVFLPDTLQEVAELEYHKVVVRGTFQHDREMLLGPRSLVSKSNTPESNLLSVGNTTGFCVVTPFKLATADASILVNRGWVGKNNKDPKTRLEGQILGEHEIEGIVRVEEKRSQFMPKAVAFSKNYLYRDLDKMAQEGGTAPVYIDALGTVEGGPIGGQTRVSIRNEHMSYIVTWYSLSILTGWAWFNRYYKGIR